LAVPLLHAALQIFMLSYFQAVVLSMACLVFVSPAPIRTSAFLIHVDARAEAFNCTILENVCGIARQTFQDAEGSTVKILAIALA
jgi:hypothetical protein